MTGTTSWTDTQVEQIKMYWMQGFSASIVGVMIGRSRSAVIGKVHRLGLSGRATKQREKKRRTPAPHRTKLLSTSATLERERAVLGIDHPRRAYSIAQAPAPDSPVDPACMPPYHGPSQPGGVPLMDLDAGQCKFPISDHDAREHRFCGCASVSGLPYCEHHAAVAYVPSRVRSYLPKPGPALGIRAIQNIAEFESA